MKTLIIVTQFARLTVVMTETQTGKCLTGDSRATPWKKLMLSWLNPQTIQTITGRICEFTALTSIDRVTRLAVGLQMQKTRHLNMLVQNLKNLCSQDTNTHSLAAMAIDNICETENFKNN